MNTVAAIAKTVDTKLADLYFQEFKLDSNASDYARLITKNPSSVQVSGWQDTLKMTMKRLEAVQTRIADLEEVFVAAGTWTRFFAVIGGHLHKDRSCSSCFPTTQFAWMPEFSAQDAEGVVDMAGEFACTVCFPDAPVNKVSMLPMHVAEREAAAERKAEREAKATKAADDKIVVGREVYKTLRAAENRISWEIESALSRKFAQAQDESHRAHLDRLSAEDLASVDEIVLAILAKDPSYDAKAVIEKKTLAKVKMFRKNGWDMPLDFRF